MKKTKRKILFLVAMIVCITIIAIRSYQEHSSFSSDVIFPEALAASENGGFNCVDAPGFCIINGLPINGVTYKE